MLIRPDWKWETQVKIGRHDGVSNGTEGGFQTVPVDGGGVDRTRPNARSTSRTGNHYKLLLRWAVGWGRPMTVRTAIQYYPSLERR